MELRVLGCSGGIASGQATTAFLVDKTLLVDAGTGVGNLLPQEMSKIDSILLTHSHLDHISHLPFLLNTLIGTCHPTIQVYALKETLEALQDHIFNNIIWPDFTQLPSIATPSVKLNAIEVGQTISIGDKQVVVLPAFHSVPSVGYWVVNDQAAFAFSGDCSENDVFWETLNNLPPVDMLIVDNQYTDEEKAISALAKHYYPVSLAKDLQKLTYQPPVYISHLPTVNADAVITEIYCDLAPWSPKLLKTGARYELSAKDNLSDAQMSAES